MMDYSQRPYVSVVIPLFNDRDRIGRAVESVLNQRYPKERLEVIVVDNGSTDDSAEMAARESVRVLFETQVRGPGAARNRGIETSVGEILAFIDSDCVAEPDWVDKGVAALISYGADLVAGDVRFVFSEKKSAAEYFDAISHMQNWLTVPTRGVAKTGNLFVRREVFDDVGLFNESLLSGQDTFFTGLATQSGHKLIFCQDAIVHHPTRSLRAILRKASRVAKGKRKIRELSDGRELAYSRLSRQRSVWLYLSPLNLRQRLIQRGYNLSFWKYLKTLMICYSVMGVYLVDRLIGRFIDDLDYW